MFFLARERGELDSEWITHHVGERYVDVIALRA